MKNDDTAPKKNSFRTLRVTDVTDVTDVLWSFIYITHNTCPLKDIHLFYKKKSI